MNWTEILSSAPAQWVYAFLANTLITYVLRSMRARNIVLTVLRGLVGALEKAAPVALLLLVSWSSTACSLESARQRRIEMIPPDIRQATPLRQISQCEALDTIHVWGDWTAGVSAGVGTAAAGLASQTEGKTADVAMGVAVGAGVVSVTALAFATQSEQSWTERCSQ